MIATSKIVYKGSLRTQAVHLASGNEIITDAPIDNQGKGEAFSPTDLVATSLASCMLTILGISAKTHGFNVDGTIAEVTKVMGDKPRRIVEIKVELKFPAVQYTDKQKAIIENSVKTCPVAYSLHPDIKQEIAFSY